MLIFPDIGFKSASSRSHIVVLSPSLSNRATFTSCALTSYQLSSFESMAFIRRACPVDQERLLYDRVMEKSDMWITSPC